MKKRRKFEPGDIVESLEVIENLGYRKYCGCATTYYRCKCTKCGTVIDVPLKNLGTAQKDCGCWRSEPKTGIQPGDRFGRLTVIQISGKKQGKGYKYLCECSCQARTQVEVLGSHLKSGEVQSCGCIHDELLRENVKKYYKENYVGGTSITKIFNEGIQQNNTSGVRGVSWHKKTQKWYARLQYKKKNYSLGYYSDLEEAKKIVEIARKHVLHDFESWYSQEYPDQWTQLQKKIAKNNDQ